MAAGDRLFGDMSQPEHAYALGFVALAGRMVDGVLEFPTEGAADLLLARLSAKTSSDIPAIYELRGGVARVLAPLGAVAASYLGAPPGDREGQRLPLESAELTRAFLRGLFDGAGSINSPREPALTLKLQRPGTVLLEQIVAALGVSPSKIGKQQVHWTGSGALDVLGQLYGDFLPGSGPGLFRQKHQARFWAWAGRVAHFQSDEPSREALRVERVHPLAVLPAKSRVSDSGYDLTLLYEKSRHGNVVLYGTGLVIEPPQGWYFDVVARSSIVKRGYMLANNVGIIDRAYRGEILVPLLKTDPAAAPLELPARIAQLIPRPIVHFPVLESALTATGRGAGGFGSTG